MVGTSVEKNLERVRERIREACERAGRSAVEVRLVAVSKGQPVEKIQQALLSKQKLFGENYVQEALPKMKAVKADWHFIGALQSNKVKQAVGVFDLIHSVDRQSVLAEISKRAEQNNLRQNILLEVNLAGETSKSGVDWKSLETLVAEARRLPGVTLRGLMGMPPPGSPEDSRPYFRMLGEKLKEWRDENFCELSMGTSQDFEVAIEEGATLVRVGTEIFGPRSLR